MSQAESSLVNSELRIGHVLLVSPQTFSYHIDISDTLRSIGYQVTWWDERASSSTLYKIVLRLFPSITVRLSERHFLKKLKQLKIDSVTHILVIKGEAISHNILQMMRRAMPLASAGLYLWDGVNNIKGVKKIYSIFDSVATFDLVDAKKFGWNYRPLFWRKIPPSIADDTQKVYDWCFVGTYHSDRHRVIHRLRKTVVQNSQNFVFLYFQSPLMLFVSRIIDWTLWFAPKATLFTKFMSSTEVAAVVKKSRSVLDVEHPHQHGFTMRTIETLLSGKKLVTTNEHITSSDLYDSSRVHVINRTNPFIPIDFLNLPFKLISTELRNYYSCEGWATELLSLQDHAKKSNSSII